MSTSPDVTSTDPQDLGEDGWVNRLIIGFLVLLAVLFVVSMVMVALQGFDAYRLKTSGEATTGVVTEASSRGLRRGLSSTYESSSTVRPTPDAAAKAMTAAMRSSSATCPTIRRFTAPKSG